MAVVTAELDRARDDQDAPRVLAARDAHDQLVGAHAQHGRGPVAAGTGVDRLAGLEGLREQAAARRDVPAGGDPRALDVRRARHEAARPELPDPDQRRAGGDADAWHASSSAESMPLGNEAISARSASRSTPAAESVSVRSIGSVARRGMRVDIDASATAAGVPRRPR